MNAPGKPRPERAREWPWLALALAATLPFTIACAGDRHLAMDGVNFLIQVAERGRMFLPTPARAAADALMQLPLLAAVRAGVRSLPVLSVAYGCGVMAPFWLGLIAAWHALPTGSKAFMALPLWSLLVLSFPLDGILTHESHVMTALLWAPLFFLSRAEPWSRLDAVLLYAVLGVLAFSYETVALPALGLAVIGVSRAMKFPRSRQRRLAVGAVILCALAAINGIVGTLTAGDAGNRANFVASLLAPWQAPQIVAGVAACALFGAGWATGRRSWCTAAAIFLVSMAVWWIARGLPPLRGGAYQARTLSLTLTPVVFAGGAALFLRQRPMPAGGFAVCVVAVVVMSGPVFRYLELWRDYRAQITRVTHASHGFVEIAGTPLERHPERNSWNLPELSLVWGGSPVRAVLVNPPEWPWEPFDPRRHLPLRRYLAFDPELTSTPAR